MSCLSALCNCQYNCTVRVQGVRNQLTLLELRLVQVSELVDLSGLASDNTLGELNRVAESTGSRSGDGVLSSLGLDLDEDDSGVFGTTVVLAVTEVTQPCLEAGGVVLADLLAIGLDGGDTGDGSPLARGLEEGEVDVVVRLEVIGLAGLAVGVEDEVDAVALLGGEGHAARDKKATAGNASGHHAVLGLVDEVDEIVDLLGELRLLLVLGDIRVGGLAAGVCVAERHVCGGG